MHWPKPSTLPPLHPPPQKKLNGPLQNLSFSLQTNLAGNLCTVIADCFYDRENLFSKLLVIVSCRASRLGAFPDTPKKEHLFSNNSSSSCNVLTGSTLSWSCSFVDSSGSDVNVKDIDTTGIVKDFGHCSTNMPYCTGCDGSTFVHKIISGEHALNVNTLYIVHHKTFVHFGCVTEEYVLLSD